MKGFTQTEVTNNKSATLNLVVNKLCHIQERMEKGTVETGMIQTHWEVRTKSAMSQVPGACKRQGAGGKDIHKRPEGEQRCAMEQTRTFLFLGSVA